MIFVYYVISPLAAQSLVRAHARVACMQVHLELSEGGNLWSSILIASKKSDFEGIYKMLLV